MIWKFMTCVKEVKTNLLFKIIVLTFQGSDKRHNVLMFAKSND